MKDPAADQARDTGLALVLVLLLVAHVAELPDLILPAICFLFAAMLWPRIFAPAARVWFGLSHILGAVASKAVLSVVFAVITTPVGVIRRLLGADAMRLKPWKGSSGSVFVRRDQRFTAEDLERPY
jgi:predicted anti-sigma-YlaC factor YlaD